MTASARQRSKECRFCQSPLPIRHLGTTNRQPPRMASGLSCSEKQKGRRPQRPGNQSALARVVWSPPGNSPSRITGCRWLCRNHSQAQELSRFALHTLSQILAPRKTKNLPGCAETVDDDISLWKAEEKQELIFQPDFPPPEISITYTPYSQSRSDSRLGCPAKAKPSETLLMTIAAKL